MSCKSEDSLPKMTDSNIFEEMATFRKSVAQAIKRTNDALSSDGERDDGNNSDQEVFSGVGYCAGHEMVSPWLHEHLLTRPKRRYKPDELPRPTVMQVDEGLAWRGKTMGLEYAHVSSLDQESINYAG
ncbi:hypothetical protein BU15DRAFT_69092 [Melanogaster broomeanus]|nr:hypothetical protein BU15DRAFT_69092 [Melanogaster broomeanus]